jgi:hypothetical protein
MIFLVKTKVTNVINKNFSRVKITVEILCNNLQKHQNTKLIFFDMLQC